MNGKVLPVSQHDYRTYPNVANLFSIISGHEETLPWVCNHFIQLVYFSSLRKIDYTNKTDSFFDPLLFDCPWLNIQYTHRDAIAHVWRGNFTRFAIDAVDMGNYLYFLADQYYIRESEAYGKHPHHHDMFIYGYDPKAEIFYIADNLRNGKYVQTTCGFEEMEQAYAHADPMKDWFDCRVMSISFKPRTYFQYERYLSFDTIAVADALSRYVNGVKPATRMCMENSYGLEVYERLQEYLTELKEGREVADIRLLHVLHEHKKLMRVRIRYMLEHGYLEDEQWLSRYSAVEKEHEVCVGVMLKYSLTGDGKLLDRIQTGLREIVPLEKELLQGIIRQLREGRHATGLTV
ncbi:hypothetical protein [Cohnella boryungensis]|uniref:Butirosin biosynthesis protein H N-terminal domain-containing protein n=1 Tax=Cohnella boryungensis TaxID=768479 RepID=A0ABV8S946_9BACL